MPESSERGTPVVMLTKSIMNLDRTKKEYYKELLLRMGMIRSFEETVLKLHTEGRIHGTFHLCIGEEAADVGTTGALKEKDYVFATHRGHGVAIGKGADPARLMAEMLGREGGCNLGRGGSMHMTDTARGLIGSNGVVGANAPLACGAALSIRQQKLQNRVSVCFMGDGAVNAGAAMESMNLAGVWRLPVIFAVIDNHYAVSTPAERSTAVTDLSLRAAAFGLNYFECDGNDVLAVADCFGKARLSVLQEEKPCLFVARTYRISGHSKSDRNRYRTEEEIRFWNSRGPIVRFCEQLRENEICTEEELRAVLEQADREIEGASAWALSQPPADESLESLTASVYA